MGYRLTRIYTRTGDDGKTNLGDKDRLDKDHARIQALGALDELNCAIGVLLADNSMNEKLRQLFLQVQQDLFNLGGELCPPYVPVMNSEKVLAMEQQIDVWNEELPLLKEFVLPGGTPAMAAAHMARAICRRAERTLISLHHQEPLSASILQYVNRLSDLLFVTARVIGKEQGYQEKLWDK